MRAWDVRGPAEAIAAGEGCIAGLGGLTNRRTLTAPNAAEPAPAS